MASLSAHELSQIARRLVLDEDTRFQPSTVANTVCHWQSSEHCFPCVVGVRLLPSVVANVVSYRHVSEWRRPSGVPWKCATEGCSFQVHSCEEIGGYCCCTCFESYLGGDISHGRRCEQVPAAHDALRADVMWTPQESASLVDLDVAWMSAEEVEILVSFVESVQLFDETLLESDDLVWAINCYVEAAESLQPILRNISELNTVSDELLSRVAYRYVELCLHAAWGFTLQRNWASGVHFAEEALTIDTTNEDAHEVLKLAIAQIESEMLDTDVRLSKECMIVPMGHYCSTALFLKSLSWRRWSFPLDYSAHTLKVWRHMLQDDFATLLQKRQAGRKAHPYNAMFQDVAMFIHQGGWANEETIKRVDRLRGFLAQNQVFGLAMYFEGKENLHMLSEEVVSDAEALAEGDLGFCHIVLVWLHRQTSNPPVWAWSLVSKHLSVLMYSPLQQMNYWDTFHPHDMCCIADLLRSRFPKVFDCRDHSSMQPVNGTTQKRNGVPQDEEQEQELDFKEVPVLPSKDREGYWDG